MVDTGKVQAAPIRVAFTQKKLAELKIAYNKAIEEKRNMFIFEDQELIVGYAKYLIEHLDNQFKTGAKK